MRALQSRSLYRRSVLFVIILCAAAGMSCAQVLTFDHGKVEFHTSSIMSDIEATSTEITVNLDIATGVFDLIIPIQSFEFEYDMMQDHFNEEYIESHLYPNATFKGKVAQAISNISGAIEVDVSGQLTIHGETKTTDFKATLSKSEDFIKVKCKFPVVFKDFKVEEPSILSKAVAKDVEVKGLLYLN